MAPTPTLDRERAAWSAARLLVGVERIFPLHGPTVASIEVVRRGRVRRAKLYYLSRLSGKAARIREKRDNPSK